MKVEAKYSIEKMLYDECQKIYQCGSDDQLKSVYDSWRKLIEKTRPKLGTDQQRQLRIQYFTYIISEGGIAFAETAIKLAGKENYKPYHGLVKYPRKD